MPDSVNACRNKGSRACSPVIRTSEGLLSATMRELPSTATHQLPTRFATPTLSRISEVRQSIYAADWPAGIERNPAIIEVRAQTPVGLAHIKLPFSMQSLGLFFEQKSAGSACAATMRSSTF